MDTVGGYCYLGYPPGTGSVRFSPLVDKIPGLLRLVQAAHRLRQAAEMAVAPGSVGYMDCATLERAREGRRRQEMGMGAAAFVAALEAVCRRMGECISVCHCRRLTQETSSSCFVFRLCVQVRANKGCDVPQAV